MQAIGIDIGTTSVCGVIMDVCSGKVIKSVTKNNNAFIDTKYKWEKIQSVERIMTIANAIVDEFITDETVAIGITGQMHGIVYIDEEGNSLGPLYTWEDGRGNLLYKDGKTYAEILNSCSGYGHVTDFYNVINGIRPKNAVTYCTIHDYFAMKLCGLTKPVLHTSDAASLGCYDVASNSFSYDYSAEITNEYKIIGKYRNVPVSIAIGDNQASVFASISSEDDILINVGTGSQISVISNEIINCPNIETRPYFEGKYLVVGAALCGGRAYSLLKDFYVDVISNFANVCEDEVYLMMANQMSKVQNVSLKTDTRFSGTRVDKNLRGAITNISTENFTPAELTHSVLVGMADELYELFKKMNVKRIGLSGSGNGIRKNPAFVKIAENKFEMKMSIPAYEEEASCGAALFAMISSGIFKDSSEVQRMKGNSRK